MSAATAAVTNQVLAILPRAKMRHDGVSIIEAIKFVDCFHLAEIHALLCSN